MAQLKRVVEPFGEVNVHPTPGGKVKVVATILMEPRREGTQTGIALDGSGSMSSVYGIEEAGGGGFFASLFGRKKAPAAKNEITPVAQKVCAYLARKLDADGGTTCIYWAVGPGGSQIEVVGDLTADQAEQHLFGPPAEFGSGTQLLPAVKYFVDRFKDAPWGFYVFITDGELHDLDAVKRYSTQLARDVAAKRRKPLKFVLIGIGSNVNESQMEELDDLETGTEVDLWDHKLASEMRVLQEIFAEVVDRNARIADTAKVLDAQGRVVKDYSDTGMTGYLEFEMPAGSDYFTLEVNGNRIHQGLSDNAKVPPSHPSPSPGERGRGEGVDANTGGPMSPRIPAVLLVLGASLAWGLEDQPARKLPAAPAIRGVLDDQVKAWNRGDLQGFMAGYWKSPELTFSSGGDQTKGWQATLDRYRKRYQGEGKEMGKLSFSDVTVEMLGPDSAFVRGRWQLVRSKDRPGGLFTLIFRRLPEGWRIIHDHTSN